MALVPLTVVCIVQPSTAGGEQQLSYYYIHTSRGIYCTDAVSEQNQYMETLCSQRRLDTAA